MNWYDIATTVLWILLGFVSIYIRTRTTLLETAQSAINTAEEHYTEAGSGQLRKSWVIERLYDLVPAPMKLFFTKEVIGDIVQRVFDYMAEFATQQLDKVAEAAGVKKE